MSPAAAFRCSAAGEQRGDELSGTASTVRAFLLMEHQGPWGPEALRDSRLPAALGPALQRHAGAHRVRPLLIRRPGRSGRTDPSEGVRVFAVVAGAWAETAVVPDLEAVLDWDLGALAVGRGLGLARHDEPIFAVCTHGRHDVCCAERGRPLALALAEAAPGQTWECSHIGGDRFAGNLLVLPDGLYYGRLTPDEAVRLAGEHAAGRLDLEHLRGRSSLPMPVQAAEIALRRRLAEPGRTAVTFESRAVDGPLSVARFRHGGTTYGVTVRTSESTDAHPLTCRAAVASPLPRHEVLDVEPVERVEG